MHCPCGSLDEFETCCSPFLTGKELPETAAQLMRSRYTAFTRLDIPYLKKTLAPEARKGFDPEQLKETASQVEWQALEILATEGGAAEDNVGTVEFKAFYRFNAETITHHELSHFRRDETGAWLFVEGETRSEASEKKPTVTRNLPKVGRNDPCVCGSGKKFKKCCLESGSL